MAAAPPPHSEIIIIKRPEEDEHEHHSSAWKVAHADFMTAMMAFFLIMWLINVTDQDVRKTLAQYFNPINLSDDIIPRRGLNDPKEQQDEGTSDDGSVSSAVKNTKGAQYGAGEDLQQGAREQALFQDPNASLAAIAAKAKQPAPPPQDVTAGNVGQRDPGTGDAQRDPFDPAYWQTVAGPAINGTASTEHAHASQQGTQGRGAVGAEQGTSPVTGSAAALASAGSSSSAYAVSGPVPQPLKGDTGAAGNWEKPTDQSAQKLEEEIKASVMSVTDLKNAPHVEVRVTKEGIVLNLTDDANFSMFAIGSAQPNPQMVQVMDKVAKILAGRPGEVVIRGYTDGRPFRSEVYDNWRLSTARAHMAHYMLARGGLDEKRFARIEGLADRNLKNAADPNAPENRRIEILLKEPVT